MPRAECFIHQSSSPSRVASLGSGQENIWRPDSRLGAKVSALPSSHPPPHFTPSLLVVTGPGKIKAGHLGLESQLFSSHDLTSEPWVLHLCVCVCVCVCVWWWWWGGQITTAHGGCCSEGWKGRCVQLKPLSC